MSVNAERFDDGSAIIEQRGVYCPSVRIDLTPEEAASVALALLGGITDDLVERCARADYVATWGDDHWDEAKERVRIDHREHARAVLAAIGDGEESGT